MKKSTRTNKTKKPFTWNKVVIVLVVISLLVIVGSNISTSITENSSTIQLINFMDDVKAGIVEYVILTGNSSFIDVVYSDGRSGTIVNPKNDTFLLDLANENVEIRMRKSTVGDSLMNIMTALPITLLLGIVLIYSVKMISQMSSAVFKVLDSNELVTFDDVRGMGEIRDEVKWIVDELKNVDKIGKMGGRVTKGLMLEGPPGTGKTLIAKAIAGEAGVPFISTTGSDFIEMYVGLGAARVRNLWKLGRLNAPCVIFIDEIDSIGGRRGDSGNAGALEANQTLNALLAKMDGLENTSGILVVAATNMVTGLDPALLRAGRFDRILKINPPIGKQNRIDILKYYLNKIHIDSSVSVERVSSLVYGMTGASIENMVNTALLGSIIRGSETVSERDIVESIEKIRASGVKIKHISDEDKELVAYHEAGHAVVGMKLGINVTKVSIVPYSSGVGGTTYSEIDDNMMILEKDLKNRIIMLMGGICAEDQKYGMISNGGREDLQAAIKIAEHMCVSGMRSNIVVVSMIMGTEKCNIYAIKEIEAIIDECKKEAYKILISESDKHKKMVEDLLVNEEISFGNIN